VCIMFLHNRHPFSILVFPVINLDSHCTHDPCVHWLHISKSNLEPSSKADNPELQSLCEGHVIAKPEFSSTFMNWTPAGRDRLITLPHLACLPFLAPSILHFLQPLPCNPLSPSALQPHSIISSLLSPQSVYKSLLPTYLRF
jgi:hypothetical protein